MTTLYTGLVPKTNPHVPPGKLRRSHRAMLWFEVCRYPVMYRLLGFPVAEVSVASGVSIPKVKFILEQFDGHMARRCNGQGPIIWDAWYAIGAEAHRRLGFPPSIPCRVDHANGGVETIDGVNVRLLKLPELEWRPYHDGYSNWGSEPWLRH